MGVVIVVCREERRQGAAWRLTVWADLEYPNHLSILAPVVHQLGHTRERKLETLRRFEDHIRGIDLNPAPLRRPLVLRPWELAHLAPVARRSCRHQGSPRLRLLASRLRFFAG